jgi:hypothetical protein
MHLLATVFAVKNAGLAIGIGVGSSFIVLVSFTWGIFVFGEHVHSISGACFAVGCMMMGLLGMAYFSAPIDSDCSSTGSYEEVQPEDSSIADGTDGDHYHGLHSVPSEEEPEVGFVDEVVPAASTSTCPSTDDVETVTVSADDDMVLVDDEAALPPTHLMLCGRKWSRRTLGILAAMFTGIYGGSIMAPMKWAPPDARGLGYLISFSIGASMVNVALWMFRYLYMVQKHGSLSRAYHALPSFHLRKMWRYGGTCGLLWSIGNFFSILSVEFLGEGVGYSVVQASMLGRYT